MANKIIFTLPARKVWDDSAYYVKDNNGKLVTYVFPLQDDPKIEYQSQFESLRDRVPQMLSGAVDTVQTFQQFSGSYQPDINNVLDILLWKKTEPVTMVFQIKLYTQDNAIKNVWLPMFNIVSSSIIYESLDGKFQIPGVSLTGLTSSSGVSAEQARNNLINLRKAISDAEAINQQLLKSTMAVIGGKKISKVDAYVDDYGAGKGKLENPEQALTRLLGSNLSERPAQINSKNAGADRSRTVTITIPGMLHLKDAIITKAIPTYSKELTSSGIPLWCILDVEIKGTKPATSQNIEKGFLLRNGTVPKIEDVSSVIGNPSGLGIM